MSIEDDVAALARDLAATKRRLAALERATGLFATNKELDSPKGDPKVKFSPKGWRGPDQKDRKFSECPPEFLDILAEGLQWSADNPRPGKENFANYNRLDARRARSWARRIRAAQGEPAAPPAAPPPPATNGTPKTGAPKLSMPRYAASSGAEERAPEPEPEIDDDDPLGLKG